MIVVDASILAPARADDTFDGDTARLGLRGHALAAPELIDVEAARSPGLRCRVQVIG